MGSVDVHSESESPADVLLYLYHDHHGKRKEEGKSSMDGRSSGAAGGGGGKARILYNIDSKKTVSIWSCRFSERAGEEEEEGPAAAASGLR